MGNALSAAHLATPPAPNPNPDMMQVGNALSPAPGNAMPPTPGQPGMQALPPPPSHNQTVAALRHFQAVEKELSGLLGNPDLGKANMKTAIIDGATKLVASGILTAAEAVDQLGTVPERPFDQRLWVEKHFQETVQNQTLVLAHHQMAGPGQAIAQGQQPTPQGEPSADNHQDVMAGLLAQYKGGPQNA